MEKDTKNEMRTGRILAQGRQTDNNTQETQRNNNDLIIGSSGAGKTRYYVKPNLLQYALEGNSSLIITDTKGSLVKEVGPVLASHGYKVIHLDFIDLMNNSVGYNPLDFISYDKAFGCYSEQEINTVSNCLVPIEDENDSFWENSARIFLSSFIGYVMEDLPKEEHTLEAVTYLYIKMGKELELKLNPTTKTTVGNILFEVLDPTTKTTVGNIRFAALDPTTKTTTVGNILFKALHERRPNSGAYRNYKMANEIRGSERTYSSIMMFLTKNLAPLSLEAHRRLYCLEDRIDFKTIGQEKTAVFLSISDNDDSMYKLANLFYTQALQELIKLADHSPKNRLPVPVRFILDDFAANVKIPEFDRIISIIRSREISVSLIIQSISQLHSLYKDAPARTIMNNCDSQLYLGGQEVETARFFATKADKPIKSILNMSRDDAWLFVRGEVPAQVEKYDLRKHVLYDELDEDKKRRKALPETEGNTPPLPEAKSGKIGPGMGVPTLVKRVERVERGELVDDEASSFISQLEKAAKEQGFSPLFAERTFEVRTPKSQVPERPVDDDGPDSWEKWNERLGNPGVRQLSVQRKTLNDKVEDLKMLLSGRNTPVLPWVLDGQERYDDDAAWALAGRMCLWAVSPSDQDVLRLYAAFFYCAVTLCASRRPWATDEFRGVFGEILDMSKEVAEIDERELYWKELFDPDEMPGSPLNRALNEAFGDEDCGFFYGMNQLYELFKEESIAVTIPTEEQIAAKGRYCSILDERYENLNSQRGLGKGTNPGDDALEEGIAAETDKCDSHITLPVGTFLPENAKEAQTMREWAQDFPGKERFCRQYEILRYFLPKRAERKELGERTAKVLDFVLDELGGSRLSDDEAFSYVCAQMDSAIAYLQKKNPDSES